MGWLRPKFLWALPAWPRCPSPQEAGGSAPDCCSLLSPCQLSTSVLPSSGGKQPVSVGLLWSQQAAFVSPNSEMLQKATEWAGDCFLGREPQVCSTMVGRSNCNYAPGPTTVCVSFETHTHSQTTRIHKHTRSHTHVSKSYKSALYYSTQDVLKKGVPGNYHGWAPAECLKPHHRQQTAPIHPTQATEQKQICETFD